MLLAHIYLNSYFNHLNIINCLEYNFEVNVGNCLYIILNFHDYFLELHSPPPPILLSELTDN